MRAVTIASLIASRLSRASPEASKTMSVAGLSRSASTIPVLS